jgi:hypothetical protein
MGAAFERKLLLPLAAGRLSGVLRGLEEAGWLGLLNDEAELLLEKELAGAEAVLLCGATTATDSADSGLSVSVALSKRLSSLRRNISSLLPFLCNCE